MQANILRVEDGHPDPRGYLGQQGFVTTRRGDVELPVGFIKGISLGMDCLTSSEFAWVWLLEEAGCF